MFRIITIVLIIFCIAVSSVTCENDRGIEFKSSIVNSDGTEINNFQFEENVRFEFYIINRNRYSISYDYSCAAFFDFLKFYQKSTDDFGSTQYIFFWKPEIRCAGHTDVEIITINPEEEKLIVTITLSEFSVSQIFIPNDYYAESMFELVIDSEKMEFKDIIYFTIF